MAPTLVIQCIFTWIKLEFNGVSYKENINAAVQKVQKREDSARKTLHVTSWDNLSLA